jgi:hypothetical protein
MVASCGPSLPYVSMLAHAPAQLQISRRELISYLVPSELVILPPAQHDSNHSCLLRFTRLFVRIVDCASQNKSTYFSHLPSTFRNSPRCKRKKLPIKSRPQTNWCPDWLKSNRPKIPRSILAVSGCFLATGFDSRLSARINRACPASVSGSYTASTR